MDAEPYGLSRPNENKLHQKTKLDFGRSKSNEKQADFGYPEIIIYSANLSSLMRILETNDWDSLTDWLLEKVVALQKAGAEFVAIGSNTPDKFRATETNGEKEE